MEMDNLKEQATMLLKGNKYIEILGIELIDVNENEISAKMPFKSDVTNLFGSVHGGALYSFADITAGTLACCCGYFCSTVSGNMNYIRGAINTEFVYCKATVTRRGKHLTVINYSITNDQDDILDDGSFTFFKTERKIF